MRKSLEDIKHMVKDIPYSGQLPDELKPYHCYILDSGHSIMCILECHLAESAGNRDMYEIPVPVRYVLEKGYYFVDGYIIVEGRYDPELGLIVDDEYSDF